jgi:hypothetical protein
MGLYDLAVCNCTNDELEACSARLMCGHEFQQVSEWPLSITLHGGFVFASHIASVYNSRELLQKYVSLWKMTLETNPVGSSGDIQIIHGFVQNLNILNKLKIDCQII